jgi:hypothetical protein
MNGFSIATQVLEDPVKTLYTFTNVGFYNPLAVTVVSFTNLVWPDGSSEPPSDVFSESWE